MAVAQSFDVAMVGHFAKDKIVFVGKTRLSSGGAVYYGGITLARMGLQVAVVTRLHPSDYGLLDELRDEGIAVYVTPAPQTSGIENTYYAPDMDRRTCVPLGFAGRFLAEDMPDVTTRVWIIGPIIAGEVDLDLLRRLAATGSPLALDIQGFIRVPEGNRLVFRDWPEIGEGLRHVRYLKVDSAEAEALTGQRDMREAARRLASYGPAEIVLTHAGGVMVYAQGSFHEAPYMPREIRGRTGRGDTTFAAYVGKRLSDDPRQACAFAAALASLKLEKPGPFRESLARVDELLADPHYRL